MLTGHIGSIREMYRGCIFIALWKLFGQVEFKRDLRERLGGEEGISAVTSEMDNKLKVNAVERLDLISMSAEQDWEC